VACIR